MNSRSQSRTFLVSGSLLAGLAVACGAFGAHTLKGFLDAPMLAIFETAVRYQMYHALALCIVDLAVGRSSAPGLATAGWCFLAGIALFSGSLYLMALSGTRWVGVLTPLGGLSLMAGWSLLAWQVWQAEGNSGR